MSITYGIVKETYVLANEKRDTYGFVAYADAEEDGTATVVAAAHDISADEKSVSKLADICNREKLSLTHFNDIVEDFLAR